MATDFFDNLLPSGLLRRLTVSTASSTTQTLRWSGGTGTIAAYATSGTSGFDGGTITIRVSPDETRVTPFALTSASGNVTFTSAGTENFTLPKGWLLRGDILGGTSSSNVTVEFWRVNETSTLSV